MLFIHMQPQREPASVIAFLQIQNRRLREQFKSFKELLQLNRAALKIALAPRDTEEQLPILVRLLFEQNEKLLKRCGRLEQEVEVNSCQALISSQIANASNEHEKYVAGELKDRLRLLKRELEAKDKRISELGSSKDKSEAVRGDGSAGVVEFTDCSKISEKLFREAEGLRKEIEMREQQLSRLRQQKDELIKLNLILTRQVSELKQYSQQTTGSQKREMNSSSDMSRYMKYQSKIAEQSGELSDEGDGDSEQGSDGSEGPSDQEDIPEKIVELKPQKVSKVVLPKLQMKKAKDIQTLIVNKINNDEKKKAGLHVKDDKLKKVEVHCEQLQRKLGEELMFKMRIERENEFLKRFIGELQQRNEMLLRKRQETGVGKDFGRERENREEGVETLLDICRDVTLNERLRNVCKGREEIVVRGGVYSKEI